MLHGGKLGSRRAGSPARCATYLVFLGVGLEAQHKVSSGGRAVLLIPMAESTRDHLLCGVGSVRLVLGLLDGLIIYYVVLGLLDGLIETGSDFLSWSQSKPSVMCYECSHAH
jgi:hypothetical protein